MFITSRNVPAVLCCFVALSIGGVSCRRPKPDKKNEAVQARPAVAPAGPKTSELAVTDPLFQHKLLAGFYDGPAGWRWTARRFAVSLDVPPPLEASTEVELDYQVPIELIRAVHNVTVTTRVNGTEVGKQTYTDEGRQNPKYPVPAALLKTSPVTVEVQLDKWGQDQSTGRDLGLIAVGVSLKHGESLVLDHDTASELAQRGYAELLLRRKMRMSTAQQNEMMKLFHQIPIWRHMWFQNVPIGKNPLDLWMMQQIIYETQPEFIVETGTYMGGSALYWAHTLNGMGLENSRVFTMDIGDFTSTAARNPLWKKYVTFRKGSSVDPAILAEIAQRAKGHRTLVTLDSDHSMEHVLNELRAYAPLVNKGSYLIVEDTNLDGVPVMPEGGPGPMAAVLKFLKDGGSKDFEQDVSREAFVMTFQPGGWLKRK